MFDKTALINLSSKEHTILPYKSAYDILNQNSRSRYWLASLALTNVSNAYMMTIHVCMIFDLYVW